MADCDTRDRRRTTLTSRSDFSEADGQQVKLTGSYGEQRNQLTTIHH